MKNSTDSQGASPVCRGHRGRGPSSFWMHDPDRVFAALDLKAGDCFIDIGCGPGDYSLEASRRVGNTGQVYAVDRDQRMATALADKAAAEGATNIKAMTADITVSLPFEDHHADVAFMATMLHTINLKEHGTTLFKEIRRVLKPGGRLAVIECKKEDQPWGAAYTYPPVAGSGPGSCVIARFRRNGPCRPGEKLFDSIYGTKNRERFEFASSGVSSHLVLIIACFCILV